MVCGTLPSYQFGCIDFVMWSTLHSKLVGDKTITLYTHNLTEKNYCFANFCQSPSNQTPNTSIYKKVSALPISDLLATHPTGAWLGNIAQGVQITQAGTRSLHTHSPHYCAHAYVHLSMRKDAGAAPAINFVREHNCASAYHFKHLFCTAAAVFSLTGKAVLNAICYFKVQCSFALGVSFGVKFVVSHSLPQLK